MKVNIFSSSAIFSCDAFLFAPLEKKKRQRQRSDDPLLQKPAGEALHAAPVRGGQGFDVQGLHEPAEDQPALEDHVVAADEEGHLSPLLVAHGPKPLQQGVEKLRGEPQGAELAAVVPALLQEQGSQGGDGAAYAEEGRGGLPGQLDAIVEPGVDGVPHAGQGVLRAQVLGPDAARGEADGPLVRDHLGAAAADIQ